MAKSPKSNGGVWEAVGRTPGAMSYAYGVEGPNSEVSSACLDEIEPVFRSYASSFSDAGRTPSIRDGMTRGDYEFYRPAEAIPRKHREIIAACDEYYHHVDILRNIIDLMSDFGSQGIEIFHPNRSKQSRYRHWFRKIGGKERSERFLNLLYRHGNVVIRRSFADLNAGDVEDLERGIAGRTPDEPEDVAYERGPRVFRNRIPIQYTFLNPTAIEVVGGDLALFAGRPRFSLRLPEPLIRAIRNPKTPDDRALVAALPDYITLPVKAGKKAIPLDPSKVDVFHYKKDDWQQWGHPLIYSVLTDVKLYEKMKLADSAALDGCISHVRLWRLGLPEHRIQPGPKAFAKLRDQLKMAGSGGTLDLIWDATLDFKETGTDLQNFLGVKKYEPVLQAIYAGLGIPQALTAGAKEGGMTSSALSLKTLIERLQYGRDLLKKFWENELNILQEAFGDRNPAQIHFENMSISDESNEKMLWVQLVDRDIISVETLREKFGAIPGVEEARIRREYGVREGEDLPDKLGPFNEPAPNADAAAHKAMQVGLVAPSQTKMKTRAKKPGDKTLLDHQKEMQDQQIDLQKDQMKNDQKLAERQQKVDEQQGGELHQQKLQHTEEAHRQKLKQRDQEHKAMLPVKKQALKKKLAGVQSKGQPGQGRPRNSRDTQKRKRRVDKPRSGASFMADQAWARSALRRIAEVLTPAYLEATGKTNMRKLSTAQAEELEDIKFRVLCSLEPGRGIGVDPGVLADPPAPDPGASALMAEWLASLDEPPTMDEVRDMQATAFILSREPEKNGDEDGDPDDDA